MTTSTATTTCPLPPLPDAGLPADFCAFALPVAVDGARSVVALPASSSSFDASRMLVLERGRSPPAVTLLEDLSTPADGVADTSRIVVTASGLNHGVALYGGYLYASSDSTVYRWNYNNDDSFTSVDNTPEIVINNINADGRGGAPLGHTTRTLAFDDRGRLYVSVGSYANVDADSQRSRIRRFTNLDDSSNFPIDFLTGQVFADGVRNEVGLAFDRHGVLWGVENGADNLRRDDLGGFITNDNPGEELHRFPEDRTGAHYGYPYCWTEYRLDEAYGLGRGTVWAWPSFLADGTVTDEICRRNYAEAELVMQAHSAPLGITFYQWKNATDLPAACQEGAGAFPPQMDGYAFIAFHGSWNREIPTGYKVVYVPMNASGRATGQPVDLLTHAGEGARWPDGFRPVDVDFDACGRLLVSSGGTSGRGGAKIVRIEYHGNLTGNDDDSSSNGPLPTIPPQTSSPTTVSMAPAMVVANGSMVWLGVLLLLRLF